MKVMWHMPVLRADACGLSIRAVSLARALVERGDQVVFLVAADKTDLGGDSVDGIPVQRVAVNRRPPRHWSLQAVARRSTAREVVGRIGFDADLLISCQPEAVSAWSDAAKCVPVLFVCSSTTLLHDAADGERQARHGPVDRMAFEIDRRLKHRNEREAFERADAVVFDSSSTLSLVTHHYDLDVGRFHAVLGGVDPNRFAPPDAATRQSHRRDLGLKQDERVAVFCSRLAPDKGADLLIRSIRHCKKLPDRVLIVGDGPEKPRLKSLARETEAQTSIDFVGRRSDVLPFLHSADLFVFPSRSESFGVALVEAMACGLPCVALRADGRTVRNASTEIIEHGESGLLADGPAPESLAAGIDRLLEDGRFAHRIGQAAARRVVERFTWARAGQAFARVVDRCVGNREGTGRGGAATGSAAGSACAVGAAT